MLLTDLYLNDWSLTIENDVAFLFGTAGGIKNVYKQKVSAIEFIDTKAFYDIELEKVDANEPGFIITIKSGMYWCSVYDADKYTVHDTMASLSRIMSEEITDLLINIQAREERIQNAIDAFAFEHGIEDTDNDDYSIDEEGEEDELW